MAEGRGGARRPATGRLRELAERTPEHRDREIDLLRALALCAVVAGHWVLVVVVHDRHGVEGLDGYNLLGVLDWTHPFTWLFQVMPVFFMVGGYANAASLDSHRRHGGDDTSWLLGRTDRLLRPTTVLLALVAAASLTAWALGADQEAIGTVSWLATLPLWFLVAYLTMVFLTPVTWALHRRRPLLVPAVLVLVVVAADIARIGVGVPYVGEVNFLVGWLAIHQMGFLWRDGMLPHRPRVLLPVAAAGLAGLIVLTALPFSPYPVSMVAVPGEELTNPGPPTVALLTLALVQLALALAVAGPVNRWLRRIRPWMAVVAANSVVLTIFLWHMVAVIIVAFALYPTGLMPQPEPGSGAWFWLRIPWFAALTVVLAALVAAFSRVEARSAGSHRGQPVRAARVAGVRVPRRAWPVVTVAGIAAAVGGLLGIALAGTDYDGPAGLPAAALLAYFAGAAVLRGARAWAYGGEHLTSQPPD
jgi:peptidoglycan/LPS O-acetylase OafA/YrhL